MNVTAYHNVAVDDAGRPLGILDGYQPGHPVTPVFAGELPEQDDEAACEQMFRLLNIGDDPAFGTPDPHAVAHRARGNRSLCIGDLVSLDERFYACAAGSWQPVDHTPLITYATRMPGTTPLAETD